nr:hypothetical protein [uncultured bacterium]
MKFRSLMLLAWIALAAANCFATPPTPTNAARAHPLAPNPHTSIGLFWMYIDAVTGRRSTLVTYKVKRCTGGGCTPTTVVASGLTNADYQDFGLTANTTYGYRYVATDGTGDSADSPTVYMATTATDDNMVHFPNATYAELLGPLTEEAQIPFAYYRNSAETAGQSLIAHFPVVAPTGGSVGIGHMSGTVAVTNNSTTVTGTGSFFMEQVSANNPNNAPGGYELNHIYINGVDAGTIASVNSNTSITLTTPWAGSTSSGLIATTDGPASPLGNYVTGNQLMYYDSPMALWLLYFSSGDPQYLRGAEQGSESIFAGWLMLGRNRDALGNVDTGPPPRNVQYSGLVLYGLAGHNGVWDLLYRYLEVNYSKWVSNYRGGNNSFTYVREKAYTILFTSWFVSAAPDSFPRSDGTTTSLNGTITVDGSMATGAKKFYADQLDIDVPGFITDDQTAGNGFWIDDGAYGDYADGDFPYPGPAQPFIQGLVADAIGYCWRNPNLQTATRNAARKIVLRSAAALGHLTYNTNLVPNNTSIRNRTIYYFYENGTRLNPFAFQHGSDTNSIIDYGGANYISWDRQSIPLMLIVYGWAKEMAGNSDPWYQQQGDEMANAAFAAIGENTGGTGDGKEALCHAPTNYKDYGQCFRTSWRYFGERVTSSGTLGTAPVVTMPSNQTLTGGVNQVTLTASVVCANTPCTYRWGLKEYPQVLTRMSPQPVIKPNNALTTQVSGFESGPYQLVFYATDALGLEGHGSVTVTTGDGQFPPIVSMGDTSLPPINSIHIGGTTATGKVWAYSPSGRTLTHSFTFSKPKDKANPSITPSATTGNVIDLTVSNLSNGFYVIYDTVTDSAGLSRKTGWIIQKDDAIPLLPPSSGHNTIPGVIGPPNAVLPTGSYTTVLAVVPVDPEGEVGFDTCAHAPPASGYVCGYNGGQYIVTALTNSWSQTAGPGTCTISNTNTIRAGIDCTGQPAGTYTFQYSGTDQQGDTTAPLSVTVTLQSGGGATSRSSRGKTKMKGQAAIR